MNQVLYNKIYSISLGLW